MIQKMIIAPLELNNVSDYVNELRIVKDLTSRFVAEYNEELFMSCNQQGTERHMSEKLGNYLSNKLKTSFWYFRMQRAHSPLDPTYEIPFIQKIQLVVDEINHGYRIQMAWDAGKLDWLKDIRYMECNVVSAIHKVLMVVFDEICTGKVNTALMDIAKEGIVTETVSINWALTPDEEGEIRKEIMSITQPMELAKDYIARRQRGLKPVDFHHISWPNIG